MPDPTASVVDNFNRANAKPPSNWSLGPNIFTAGGELAIESNVLSRDNAGSPPAGENNIYYNASNYGPDVEVVFKMQTVPTALNDLVRIYARMTNIGSGTSVGYAMRVVHDGTAFRAWRCQRRDTGAFVQLGSDQTQAVAAGDSIGFQIVGTTLRFYWKTGSTWTQVGTDFTDSTYSAAGKVGIGITGYGPTVDDFAVQTLSSTRTRPYIDITVG